jgi:hypothetical protein
MPDWDNQHYISDNELDQLDESSEPVISKNIHIIKSAQLLQVEEEQEYLMDKALQEVKRSMCKLLDSTSNIDEIPEFKIELAPELVDPDTERPRTPAKLVKKCKGEIKKEVQIIQQVTIEKNMRSIGIQTNPLSFGPPTTTQFLLGEIRPWGVKAECLPMKGLGMYKPKPAKLKPINA